eukprot:4862110-Amphidinium_carterae.1
MPQETFGWKGHPSRGSPTTWGTSGWYTNGQAGWIPNQGTPGSLVGVPPKADKGIANSSVKVPPNREEEVSSKRINKKVIMEEPISDNVKEKPI